jgi:hypothetical protein
VARAGQDISGCFASGGFAGFLQFVKAALGSEEANVRGGGSAADFELRVVFAAVDVEGYAEAAGVELEADSGVLHVVCFGE